jgi:Circularly permutated YpsA SLOG family
MAKEKNLTRGPRIRSGGQTGVDRAALDAAVLMKRKHLRQVDRDPEVNEKVGERQIEAIVKWGIRREGSYDYLKTIKQHEFRP